MLNFQTMIAIVRRHLRPVILAAFLATVVLFIASPWSQDSPSQRLGSLVGGSDHHVDTFKGFRQAPGCQIRSADLYVPKVSLCKDKGQLLEAMSGGGRIGFDQPYETLRCGMKWYSTSEICRIMSKFDYIHLVGDSMIRHLAQAINVFIREDLVFGARATWKNGNPEGLDCYCHTLFDKHKCATDGYAAIDTVEVWQHDPNSIKCDSIIGKVDFTMSSKHPPEEKQVARFATRVRNEFIEPEPPIKRKRSLNEPLEERAANRTSAFIFGHGGWDDFEIKPGHQWVNIFEKILDDPTKEAKTYLEDSNPFSQPPMLKTGAPNVLFITPNAQGYNKEEFFIPGQNNIKLMHFEREMSAWLNERGWDVLGMWNMTIQSVSVDGTHATMESNLIKAQMVFNWLDML